MLFGIPFNPKPENWSLGYLKKLKNNNCEAKEAIQKY